MPRKATVKTLLSILYASFAVISLQAAEHGRMKIHQLDGPAKSLVERGGWSTVGEDTRLDLTGFWKVVRSDGVDLGVIDLPFAWEKWQGELILIRSFTLSDSLIDYSHRLVVDGFAQYIAITLNGTHLDTRRGEGLSYQIHLDPSQLRCGDNPNSIEIRLDNRLPRRGNIPHRGSIHARRHFGGIFRDIYIVSSPAIAITDIVADLSNKAASAPDRLNCAIELRRTFHAGADTSTAQCRLEFTIHDPLLANLVEAPAEALVFPPGGVLQRNFKFNLPAVNPWNLSYQPDLYIVKASLLAPDMVHHSEALFGVRSFVVNKYGFILNGEKIWLRCVDYPEGASGKTVLADEARLEADLNKIKELGAHAIRIFQGWASMQLLDLCDRHGILVFEELPVFQVPDPILADPDFIKSAQDQLKTIIQRDKRFTCIAGWGIGSQINSPNDVNYKYYKELTDLIHSLDDRPVYAVFPARTRLAIAPLDFAILDVSAFDANDNVALSEITCDRPYLIGGVGCAVIPENLRGGADTNSEVGQADYIVKMVKAAETRGGACAGIVISAFIDWEGAVPSISSPTRGQSILYTNGICDTTGKPRLAYHVLREYWASGREQPLAMTAAPREENTLILVVGLFLVIFLFIAIRRNNLLKFNLGRTFTSPRGFFQDISERRYTQTGQTVLLAMMISGAFSLLAAGWLYTNRRNYSLDWLLGFLFGDTDMLRWIADLVWHPGRALAFIWGLSFILAWFAAIRLVLLCKILGRPCSVNQSLAFFSWSSASYLLLLPIGMLSQRLYEGSMLWLVLSILIILSLWSHQRLMSVIAQHVRKPEPLVTILWFVGPIILLIVLFMLLEYTYQVTDYWGFFWGTIA